MSAAVEKAGRAERILVRGVNWLGDAVMTTPALVRLREARPRSEIVMLTPAKLADLWPGHPAVDRVELVEPGESVWSVGRRLRAGGYDVALVFPNSPRSALEVFFAGIPMRVGHARRWRRWLLTHPVAARAGEVQMHKRSPAEVRALVSGARPRRDEAEISAGAHHVHQYLHLVAALGGRDEVVAPVIRVSDGELAAVRGRFGGGVEAWLGVNAGAEYGPAKRWPAERFVAAAAAVHRATGCAIRVLGGPADREIASGIASGLRAAGVPVDRVRSVAGEMSLRELCAMLKACRVVLTNDTGPMHVAAAVGTPVVVPFGSTSWRLTGPGLPGDPRHRFIESGVPCAPCFLRECPIDFRCLQGIAVERVVSAVISAWG